MKGKRNFGRSGIRRIRFLIASSLVMFLMVLVATFRFSTHAAFVTKTWDGGGSTNNWSEAANWSDDIAPVAGDSLIFDGTSTKNAVVDASFNIFALNVNSGYSGTVSISNGSTLTLNGSSSLNSGTLSCGTGGTIFFTNVSFTQTAGTFNCLNGTFDSNIISLNLN